MNSLPVTEQLKLKLELEKRRREKEKSRKIKIQGKLKKVFESTADEVLVSGPAGTGKSMLCLLKLHTLAEKYPGMRALICRKFRTDLSEAGLVTYEDDILGPGHPLAQGIRRVRQSYNYDNGSVIVVGGLDQKKGDGSTKVMSAQYDIIYVQEATELAVGDWENLITRLRNGKMPFQQLIADCNPSSPSHWLKVRADSGTIDYYESTHKDNPTLWDEETKKWTERGRAYLKKLSSLTGFKRKRLFQGLWEQPEGIVYENFTIKNITTKEPDPFYPISLAYDDGFHPDPRFILFIQKVGDEVLVFDEYVANRELAESSVKNVVSRFNFGWPLPDYVIEAMLVKVVSRMDNQVNLDNLTIEDVLGLIPVKYVEGKFYLKKGFPLPEIAIGGSESKELQRRFKEVNIPARGATHSIVDGIEKVRRHISDANDRIYIKVHQRCTRLLQEIQGDYVYPSGGKVNRRTDLPLDENNHGCDALRYYIWLKGKA